MRVVDRVVAILEELADRSGKFGDVALAEKLGLHKSTVHRLLAVLQRNGFVEREPGCTKYRLGWRIFALRKSGYGNPGRQNGSPYLQL